ncbi:MAG: hypothetical protein KC983_02485 [Phycisphaerales bacterium]|nr:hypothetical protein [Phycisphaerales bacterium]
MELIAHETRDPTGWLIEPAPRLRGWFPDRTEELARRCLPMTMANQAGWVIRVPCDVNVMWSGKSGVDALTIAIPDDDDRARHGRFILSNFGGGIVTFALPWLFRTSPGIGLWVHGLDNEARSDAAPLSGLVETDWAVTPFTMSWRLLKRKTKVYFKAGEALCVITPYPMDLLEQFEPVHRRLVDDPPLHDAMVAAIEQRRKTNAPGAERTFELDYVRGTTTGGTSRPPDTEHRTTMKVKPFVDDR